MAKPIRHRRREPAPGIFRLVLPLPFPGLDRVNAFLISDAGGTYSLVDCGIYMPDESGDHGWDELVAALAVCEVEVSQITRLVVTHGHIDHYGMAGRVVEATGAELCMHESAGQDLELYRNPAGVVEGLRRMFVEHGVAEDELGELTQYEDWRPFVSAVIEPDHPVTDGDTLRIGRRDWRFVYTPGHARSHICIWSQEDGILISGDHLLPTVTPHIDFKRGVDDDPLGDFLRSLDKVERLDPRLVLPGHGAPFEEGAERARVVARHHDRRLGSILQVIRHRPASADTITDEIFGDSLLHFEHRLALGEALAHLAYLRKRGEIERTHDGGTILYQKVKRQRREEDDE